MKNDPVALPPGRRFARPAALAGGVLLTVGAAWLLAHEGHAPLPTRGAQVDVAKGRVALSRDARAALDVATAEIDSRPVPETVLAYATLVPPWTGRAVASARLAGRVSAVHARAGQTVEAGQVLAEVESLELEDFRRDLRTAHAERALAARLAADLATGSAVSAQARLEAQSRLRQAEIALEVARGKGRSLGLDAGALHAVLGGADRALTLPVRSPLAGTVTVAAVPVGKVVEPAETLFEVVDLGTVWVRVGVLERDLHRVAVGQPVELTLPAFPGETFPATLKHLGPDLDPVTHLASAWAELTNPPGETPRFRPGLRGAARLLVPGPAKARSVPAGAVFGEGGLYFVLIEESHTAAASEYQRKPVAVGRRSAGRAELTAGEVVPGERVVTRGGYQLAGYFVPEVLRPGPVEARALGLVVEPVRPQVVEDVVELEGEVELPPQQRAAASAPLAGALLRLPVAPGQAVRAGAVVAEVASLELQSLQLDLLKAHLDGRLLEETRERLRPLEGVASRRRLLELDAQVEANRLQRDSLDRKLAALGLTAEQRAAAARGEVTAALPVRAPIDGAVAGCERVLGQAVRADEPLILIHDTARPLVRGWVPESELARVRPGQAARVRLTADPAFAGEGTVVRGGGVVGADSRALAVWVELRQLPDRPLRHGQLARLTLTVSQPEPVLALPRAAVVEDGAQRFAFVRRADGAFERRAVETGRADDRLVEIVAGLAAGEPVAVGGAAELQTAFATVR